MVACAQLVGGTARGGQATTRGADRLELVARLLITSLLLEGFLESLIFCPLTEGEFGATGQRSDPRLAALMY